MRKFRLGLFITLISLCQLVFGQEKFIKSKGKYVIPFQLTDSNNIAVKAIVNGKDTVNLMFHTAASSVTLTEEAIKELTSLTFDKTDSVKSWGGGGNSSRFSKKNLIQIGDLSWPNVPIWENKNSGPKTDGKFGMDLFENKVVEIDFNKKVIILHTNLPSKTKKYEKLKLIVDNELMFLESTCEVNGRSFKNKYLLHSGYSGAVLFDDQFVSVNKIDEKLKIIDEKELKDSFGNVLKTKKAILPTLSIGNEKLSDVPVGFFSGSIGRQKMSIIGGDILKRFNIIIDTQRDYIYLKTNDLKNVDFINV